jgi:hypothetical protein
VAHSQAPTPSTPVDDPKRIPLIIVGLTTLVTVLLLAFALPAVHTGAHGIPVGVVGSAAQVQQIQATADGFEVTAYADDTAARTAVLDREVYGAIELTDDGSVTTLVASAASYSAATAVEGLGAGLAEATGTPASVTDLRALPADDPRGAGLSAGALPLALGGWIAATVIMLLVQSPRRRVATAVGFAFLGGFVLTAVLRWVTGTFDDNYLLTALGATLGIAATAMAVLGLRSLLGGLGLGIAAVALVLLGNPLSGLASAPEMLPSPWGQLGQLLPPGATGALLRDLAFFDGHGSTHALVVLGCWLMGGTVFYVLGVLRHRNKPDTEIPEHEIEEALDIAHTR